MKLTRYLIKRPCIACQAYLDHNIQMGEHFPELLTIMQRDNGLPTVLAFVEAQLQGVNSPTAKEIAKRFTTSLSQVRKVIKEAGGMNFIKLNDDGRIVDASNITTTYKNFIARELSLYAKYGLGLENYFVAARKAA